MNDPEFVHVNVEPGPASEDGVSMRWKRAALTDDRVVREVPYESEAGLDGTWRVLAADDEDATQTRAAHAVLVDDSSDGVAWLVVGGTHGLVLEHADSGARAREPYLLLSKSTSLA
jgi:hypothetical protein